MKMGQFGSVKKAGFVFLSSAYFAFNAVIIFEPETVTSGYIFAVRLIAAVSAALYRRAASSFTDCPKHDADKDAATSHTRRDFAFMGRIPANGCPGAKGEISPSGITLCDA